MELEDLGIYHNMTEKERVEQTILSSIRTQIPPKSCYKCIFCNDGFFKSCSIFQKRVGDWNKLPECLIFAPDNL